MLLSIMGLYEYDNNMFQGLQVPEGLNREAVINEILLQCAELEVIYPDINIMKLAITTWSLANQYTWEKLYDTMVVEYNPIWNVDAEVHQTDRLAGSDMRTIGRNESITPNLTDTRSVKGFNSDTWAETEKTVQTGNSQDYENVTDNATDDHTRTYSETRTGNIGVTTTQHMLEEERQLAEFNMINYIAQSFKQRFCLLIY